MCGPFLPSPVFWSINPSCPLYKPVTSSRVHDGRDVKDIWGPGRMEEEGGWGNATEPELALIDGKKTLRYKGNMEGKKG